MERSNGDPSHYSRESMHSQQWGFHNVGGLLSTISTIHRTYYLQHTIDKWGQQSREVLLTHHSPKGSPYWSAQGNQKHQQYSLHNTILTYSSNRREKKQTSTHQNFIRAVSHIGWKQNQYKFKKALKRFVLATTLLVIYSLSQHTQLSFQSKLYPDKSMHTPCNMHSTHIRVHILHCSTQLKLEALYAESILLQHVQSTCRHPASTFYQQKVAERGSTYYYNGPTRHSEL